MRKGPAGAVKRQQWLPKASLLLTNCDLGVGPARLVQRLMLAVGLRSHHHQHRYRRIRIVESNSQPSHANTHSCLVRRHAIVPTQTVACLRAAHKSGRGNLGRAYKAARSPRCVVRRGAGGRRSRLRGLSGSPKAATSSAPSQSYSSATRALARRILLTALCVAACRALPQTVAAHRREEHEARTCALRVQPGFTPLDGVRLDPRPCHEWQP